MKSRTADWTAPQHLVTVRRVWRGRGLEETGARRRRSARTSARFALALALVFAVVPRAALAAEPIVIWVAPEECPSPAEFSALLTRALGEPVERFESRARFRAEVARDGEGYRLSVRDVVGGAEARELADARCDALADAAAVVIALALRRAKEQEEQSGAGAEPGAATNGDPRDEVAPTATVPTSNPSPPARRGRGQGLVFAALLADHGSLPRWAAGARAGFGYRLGTLAARAHFGWVGPRATAEEPGGRFWLVAPGGELCAVPFARAAVELALCGTLEAGWLTGRGTGIGTPRRGTADWLALGGRLGTAMALGPSPWRVELGVALLRVVDRSAFFLDGPEPVHWPEPVAGRLELGLSRTFR